MEGYCDKLLGDDKVKKVYFAVLGVVLILILYYQYKKESLVVSGVEIPVDYLPGEDSDAAGSIVPNAYYGNSTGGISKGAAARFAQQNTSGTASPGTDRNYIYTSRMDEGVRNYTYTDSAPFVMAHGGY